MRFKEIKWGAFWRDIEGYGHNYTVSKKLWQSKSCAWNHLYLRWGIRNSKIPQRVPIWNMSNNSSRALMFGFNFWHVTINYHRAKSFDQRKRPFMNRLRNFYQLVN